MGSEEHWTLFVGLSAIYQNQTNTTKTRSARKVNPRKCIWISPGYVSNKLIILGILTRKCSSTAIFLIFDWAPIIIQQLYPIIDILWSSGISQNISFIYEIVFEKESIEIKNCYSILVPS